MEEHTWEPEYKFQDGGAVETCAGPYKQFMEDARDGEEWPPVVGDPAIAADGVVLSNFQPLSAFLPRPLIRL